MQQDVFDQSVYEARVDSEADLMITLEALKDTIGKLENTMKYVQSWINTNSKEIDEVAF